ncbi:hypothetical protein JYU34_011427 [Plutella xylostella]|uniref:Uncharacterized protein n=1 Tax=Plutella xylostella TaxID=51655 RepID=A0ABQ7QH10_PLUXY|nr:hypothetical protein JYU34_011427 [Plutella xylostella]
MCGDDARGQGKRRNVSARIFKFIHELCPSRALRWARPPPPPPPPPPPHNFVVAACTNPHYIGMDQTSSGK